MTLPRNELLTVPSNGARLLPLFINQRRAHRAKRLRDTRGDEPTTVALR